MLNFSSKEIDKIIDSMNKRITAIIKRNGQSISFIDETVMIVRTFCKAHTAFTANNTSANRPSKN